jgi:lysyl endopeptidase
MKSIRLAVLLLMATTGRCLAQLESETGNISGFSIEKWYEVSVDSNIIHTLRGLDQPKDRPYQFAFPVQVALDPGNSGFFKRSDHELIWTIGIRSAGAKSLNVILKPFNIPAGSYVYVYDQDRKMVRGAFSNENNNSSMILPVMPVPGEALVLEYHIPNGSDWHGTLGISQVSYDFLGLFTSEAKDEGFGASGNCNVDINCPEGADYTDQRRAVCRIIIDGIELCSGVLVNNTNHENRALMVTAQHCISSESQAANSLFVFGYESPWCSGPDGHTYHSISGSVLRATNPDIDFTLVELSSFPPFTYHPYLAGWDVSALNPGPTVVIHHPLGDVKKISVDLDSPQSATYTDYVANGFWKIIRWDKGTTEGGSSGSPLFNKSKRVVGMLTGGEATCMYPVNDYFAKLSVSYNLSPYLWMQLKGWIDPAVTNLSRYDGRDPYAANLLTVDTLSNLSSGEQRLITPYTAGGTGYSTGYNSDSLTVYAEYFKNPAAKEVSEILMNIASVNSVLPVDSVSLYVLADGSEPGAVLAHQKIYFSEAKDTFVTKADFRNTIITGGNFYVAWRIYYKTLAYSETRQFAVFHSPDRIDTELNTAWFFDGASWKKFTMHPFAPGSVSLDVKVVVIGNSKPDAISEQTSESPGFNVYPNPARELIVVSSDNIVPEAELSLYDMRGVPVYREIIKNGFPGKIERNISSLGKGIYYLVITTENGRQVHKLVIGI